MPGTGSMLDNVVNRVNDNTKRTRQVEETLRNIKEQLKTLQDESLKQKKEIVENEVTTKNILKETRDRIANLEVDITRINKELKDLVLRRELKELENYINLINPITSKFVTKKEVEEIIEEKCRNM